MNIDPGFVPTAILAPHEGEPATLPPPELPAARTHGGLNFNDLFDPSQPVVVQVFLTADIIQGDTLELFRGEVSLASVPVVTEQDFMTFNVYPRDIPDGDISFHYHLYGSVGQADVASRPVPVLVKRSVPGGSDRDPGTPYINERLLPPTGFGAIAGPGAVRVTIPPYENMQVGDVVTLSWAGVLIPYTVAAGEEGGPVYIVVSADIVGQNPGVDLVVRYEVRDKVNNWSLWSPSALVEVTDPNALPAPRVEGVVDKTLDLAVVGTRDVNVQIPTGKLTAGDRVVLLWRGQIPEGPVVEYRSPPREVRPGDIGFGIALVVPNDKVIGLAGAQVTVSYRVSSDLAPERGSLITSFVVIGELKGLDLPRVQHAQGDILDPADVPAGGTTVHVPKYSFMEEFDYIVLEWDGVTAAGRPFYYSDNHEVSLGEVGSDIPFRLTRENVTVLAGGNVEVYYSIEPASQPGSTLNSPRLALAIRGASGNLLIPPDVVDAVDGTLDPITSPDPVLVKVGQYEGKAIKDVVTLHWDGSVASQDFARTVSDRYLDRDLDFLVDKAALVTPNSGTRVDVWYSVTRFAGGAANSQKVAVRIGEPIGEQWPAPRVLQANPAESLNPVNARNGATVRVAYAGMRDSDLIVVVWEGSPGLGTPYIEPQHASVTGTVDFPVPISAVAANLGRRVSIVYFVVRGDQRFESLPLSLSIALMPSTELGPPSITQANAGQSELDLGSFAGDATVIRTVWPLIGAGQKIWLTVEGTANTVGAEPLSVSLASGRAILPAEVAQGLAVTLPRVQLQRFKPDTDLTLRLLVSFDGGGVASQATAFDVRTLNLKAANETASVLGGRSQSGPFYYANPSRLIAISVDPQATYQWQYEGRSERHEAAHFIDTNPTLELTLTCRTSVAEESQTLRALNVTGNSSFSAYRGGCVVKDDGTLFSWGGAAAAPPGLARVRSVVANARAYAAVHDDGHVTAWGDAQSGGTAPLGLAGVMQVVAASNAFAAVHVDGSVTAWGSASNGGAIPVLIAAQLSNIIQLIGADSAFAALRADGEVFCWGGEQWPYGMNVIAARGSQWLTSTNNAFAAVTRQKSAVAWGLAADGGSIPAELVGQLIGVESIASTSSAFAARTSTGRVFAWGDARFGGVAPGTVNNARHVVGSTTAFGVLTASDDVIAWGVAAEGGLPPPGLKATTLVAGYGSFAACRLDGSAVSWGFTTGDYPGNDARAVYAAGPNFLVLAGTGKVVGWGRDNVDFRPLDGALSHVKNPSNRLRIFHESV